MSTVSGLEIANNVEREWRDRLEAAVKAAVEAERQACAKVCEEDAFVEQWKGLAEAARRIRARSSNAP